MRADLKQTWIATGRALSQHRWTLLKVHLIYGVLGIVLLAPLVGALLRWLLSVSGTTVLADQEIAWFLLSPLGLASLVLMIAVIVAIAALEQASLMAIPGATGSGFTRLLRLLGFAAVRSRRILSFTLQLVARVLALALPFIALGGAVGWLLLSGHDINYYLAAKPAEFWLAIAAAVVLVGTMLVVIGRRLLAWSLALPLLLFTDLPATRTFAESQRLTDGQRHLVFGVLLAWLAAVIVLAGLVTGTIGLAGRLTVPQLQLSLTLLVPVLGLFALLWFGAQFLLTAFNAGSFAFALVELSRRCAPELATAIATPRRPETATAAIERRATAPRLSVILSVGAVLAGGAGLWLVNSIPDGKPAAIVAHRGAAGAAPENTLAAVEQALDDGADWIEIDVQESADGEVVVIHDSDFMKLAGIDLKVWDASLAQMRALDIGSWFDSTFADQRVPTLREVLDAARGRARVVIELKYYGHDQQLEQRVIDIVEAADAVDRVAVMSLSYEAVRTLHALRPDWTIGLLTATAVGDLTTREADFLAVNSGIANAGFIRRAHAAGREVWVWTVNDAPGMARLMSLGVDAIITDEPALGIATRREHDKLSQAERLLLHAAILFGQPTNNSKYRDQSP